MVLKWIAICLVLIFVLLSAVEAFRKPKYLFMDEPEQKNPVEGKRVVFVFDDAEEKNADGVRGHLEAAGNSERNKRFYEKYTKRALDVVASFFGLVILCPVMVCIAIAIKAADPGPVLFAQKRVGENKQFFKLHKFRSMKMGAPHDVPTHMLDNPEQYMTKVGRFIRKYSLDELPQMWDIFVGNMSVVGPRPALWNQDYLVAKRDEYGANDIKPGLTGWAQINGRDTIDIEEKAKLDGEYTERVSFIFDCKCFFGTFLAIIRHEGIAEGANDGKRECVNK